MSMRKLSIVSTGRNDDHGGRFIDRVYASIRSISELARVRDFRFEYIFVEWNPVPDKLLIASMDHLWKPLTNPHFDIRFIIVPTEYHNAIQYSDQLPIFQMISKNIGIRRAKYDAILATTSDILFGPFLSEIFQGYTCHTDMFYRCARYDISQKCLDYPTYHDQVTNCHSYVLRQYPPYKDHNKLYTNACGDFTLAHREVWDTVKGYIEWPMYSIHIDSLFLIVATHLGIKQKIFPPGARIYHIEHEESWTPDRSQLVGKSIDDKGIPRIPDCCIYEYANVIVKGTVPGNKKNWGALGLDFKEITYRGIMDGITSSKSSHKSSANVLY